MVEIEKKYGMMPKLSSWKQLGALKIYVYKLKLWLTCAFLFYFLFNNKLNIQDFFLEIHSVGHKSSFDSYVGHFRSSITQQVCKE